MNDAADKTIDIAIATDQNLVRYCPTLFNSISRNTRHPVNIVILCRGLTDAEKAVLLELQFGNLSVEIIPMDEYFADTSLNLLAHTTLSTMDRLFLPDLLPDTSRILYLDIDITVLDDLGELFNHQTPECGICAKSSVHTSYSTLSALIDIWGSDRQQLRQVAGARGQGLRSTCFNAGVIVLDLDLLRQQDFVNYSVSLVERFGINDQLVLNLFAAGEYRELDPGWNVFVGQDNPPQKHIIHWAGPHKPWGKIPVPGRHIWGQYYLRVEALER